MLEDEKYWNVEDQAVILLYHGVTESPSFGVENFSGKHISATVFDRQMAWIKANANPISLREMVSLLGSNKPLPKRSVSVTLDDRFLNNRTVALPILEKHQIPATFFVTTGFIGSQKMFWTDKVEHSINLCSDPFIEVTFSNGNSGRWDIETAEQKIKSIIDIKNKMKTFSDIEDSISRLLDACSMSESDLENTSIPNYQMMNWSDVMALDNGLCEVGGHGVSHKILSYLSPEDLYIEVNECIRSLSERLDRKVDLFSYPEGQANHYNERVITVLKKSGISISPSAIRGTNSVGSDPFNLRRIMVGFMGEPFPWDAD